MSRRAITLEVRRFAFVSGLYLSALGALGLLLAGCINVDTDPSDPIGPIGPGPTGRPCPDRHLVIGARGLGGDRAPGALYRFDEELQQCNGWLLPDNDDTELLSVGGMPDGSDLLGFELRAMRVRDQTVVFDVETDLRVTSIFPLTVAGRLLVGMLLAQPRSTFTERIDLLDADTGDVVKSYDTTSSDDRGLEASVDHADRLVVMDQYDGFKEVRVDLSAEALGGVGELEVLAPRGIGSARRIAVGPGHVAIASRDGIVHWNASTPSALGPSQCRWPLFAGESIPTCDEYRSVETIAGRNDRWMAICDAVEEDTTGSPSLEAVVVVTDRDGCAELLRARALPDNELVDLAWSGL